VQSSQIAGLQVSDIVAYLGGRGWTEVANVSSLATAWELDTGTDQKFRVTAPISTTARDFERRLSELISDLAEVEKTTPLDLIVSIREAWVDVVRVRVQSSIADFGSIPVSLGVNVFENIRNLLSAAGRSTLNARSAYAARPPSEVTAFLRSARFGPTETSSYVTPIFSPAASTAQDRRDRVVPFSRQLVTTLSRGLTSVREAAERATETAEMKPFSDVVDRGVSANLCDAIVQIANASIDGALEIDIAWAAKQPIVETLPRRTVISRQLVPAIKEAADYLRELEPEPDFDFQGTIFRLEDIKNEAHDLRATAVGIVADREKSVNFIVPLKNRDAALTALDQRLTIKCTGTLDRRARPYALSEIVNFALTGTAPADLDF
jgi:hypothetical protein